MRAGHVLILSEPSSLRLFREIEVALNQLVSRVTHLRYGDEFDPTSELWRSVDVLLAYGGFSCTRQLMSAAPSLRAVVSPWTGTEGFDEAAATELGVVVANGHAEESTFSMAEATVMLMLACVYSLHETEEVLRKNDARPPYPIAHMLRGSRVGLVGFGSIGRQVARLLEPWGVEIVAYNRSAITDANVRAVDLPTLLSTSDIISLHIGLSAATRHLLNAENLKLVRPGAILVNTARGGVIDEAALYEHARDGRFAKIALDVYEQEPLSSLSPLRALPNAILTPHMAGLTREARDALVALAIQNITQVLDGEPPVCVRNPEVIAHWGTRRER